MSKVINLSPDALEIVNQMLDKGTLEDTVVVLECAEDSLQQQAFESDREDNKAILQLYNIAFQLKLLKNDFTKLKNILYGTEE